MALWYNNICNSIALQQLLKPCHIPDFKLMVGTAEHLASLPVLVYQDYIDAIPEPLRRPMDSLKYEDTAKALENGSLTVDDFVGETFFLGDPLGGI